MKIVTPNSELRAKFRDLCPGDVFRSDSLVFMRLNQGSGGDADSVDLETGHVRRFYGNNDVVHLPKAKLVLGDE